MEKFVLYKNKYCTDTAILPMLIVPTEHYLVLKIQWFNVSSGEPWAMGIKETIKIKNEDVKNWIKL